MQLEPTTKQALKRIRFRDARDRAAFINWLGVMNKRRAALRIISPYAHFDISKGLAARLMMATFPWSCDQYPGKHALLADILGVKRSSAARMSRNKKIGYPSAQRAAKWLRDKAATFLALAEELEQVPENENCFEPGDVRVKAINEARAFAKLARQKPTAQIAA